MSHLVYVDGFDKSDLSGLLYVINDRHGHLRLEKIPEALSRLPFNYARTALCRYA